MAAPNTQNALAGLQTALSGKLPYGSFVPDELGGPEAQWLGNDVSADNEGGDDPGNVLANLSRTMSAPGAVQKARDIGILPQYDQATAERLYEHNADDILKPEAVKNQEASEASLQGANDTARNMAITTPNEAARTEALTYAGQHGGFEASNSPAGQQAIADQIARALAPIHAQGANQQDLVNLKTQGDLAVQNAKGAVQMFVSGQKDLADTRDTILKAKASLDASGYGNRPEGQAYSQQLDQLMQQLPGGAGGAGGGGMVINGTPVAAPTANAVGGLTSAVNQSGGNQFGSYSPEIESRIAAAVKAGYTREQAIQRLQAKKLIP